MWADTSSSCLSSPHSCGMALQLGLRGHCLQTILVTSPQNEISPIFFFTFESRI